jgi:acyl carrier protein
MTIASRTPEGLPCECPVCGNLALVESCYPGGDAVCPSCGHLLWQLQNHLYKELGVPLDRITLETLLPDGFAECGIDSLEWEEIIMGLEENLGITISEKDYEKIQTVRDLIDYLRRRQEEG